MDDEQIEILSTTTTLSETTEPDQAETRKMEYHDGPSTSSGLGGHTTPAEAEKTATKMTSKLSTTTAKSSATVEKQPGQPTKGLKIMSTCELKACLRARRLSTSGKKSTLRDRLLTDISKTNSPKKELMEGNKFDQDDDSTSADNLSKETDSQEMGSREEQHRNQYEDLNGKSSRLNDDLNLALNQTSSTEIAGLRNNNCSNAQAGVRLAAPNPSTVAGVRQRRRQQNRFHRCFRCNTRHPYHQQCW